MNVLKECFNTTVSFMLLAISIPIILMILAGVAITILKGTTLDEIKEVMFSKY